MRSHWTFKVPKGKDDMRGALEALTRNAETMIEYSILMARIRKASYDAHVKEGFTEAQALELCKSIT